MSAITNILKRLLRKTPPASANAGLEDLKQELLKPTIFRESFQRRFSSLQLDKTCLSQLEAFILEQYSLDSSLLDGFSRIALLMLAQGKVQMAANSWNRDRQAKRISWWQELRSAEALLMTTGVEAARQHVLSIYSSSQEARNGLASLGLRLGPELLDAAVCLFEEDERLVRLSPHFRLDYAVLLARKEKLDEARRQIDTAYRADSSLLNGHARVAWEFLWRNRRREEALEWLLVDDELNRLTPGQRLNLGQARAAAGDIDAALRDVEKAYALDRRLLDGYSRVAWQYYWPKREYAEALRLLQNDEQQGRLSPGHRLNLAQVLAAKGQIETALRQVKLAYTLNPSLKNGFSRIAWQYYWPRKEYSEAVQLMLQDSKAGRLDPVYRLNLAQAFAAMGRLSIARMQVKLAYTFDPTAKDGYARVAWQHHWPRKEYAALLKWMRKDLHAGRLSPSRQEQMQEIRSRIPFVDARRVLSNVDLSSPKVVFFMGFHSERNTLKRKFWLESLDEKRFSSVFVFDGAYNFSPCPGTNRYHFGIPGCFHLSPLHPTPSIRAFFSALLTILRMPSVFFVAATREWREVLCCVRERMPSRLLASVCGFVRLTDALSALKLSPSDRIITWGNTSAGHALLKGFAAAAGTPVVLAEDGELQGSVMIAENDFGSGSWPRLRPKEFISLPLDQADLAKAEEYISLLMKERVSRPYSSFAVQQWTDKARFADSSSFVIYVNGVFDFRLCRPLLRDVIRAAKKHNWTVLYKDHPYFQNVTSAASGLTNEECLTVLGNVNVNDVLEVAHVTVTPPSKTVFNSLIRNVPVVLTQPFTISQEQLAYGLVESSNIETAIEHVLSTGGVDRKGLVETLARLMKYYLYSTDDKEYFFPNTCKDVWNHVEEYISGRRPVISCSATLLRPSGADSAARIAI